MENFVNWLAGLPPWAKIALLVLAILVVALIVRALLRVNKWLALAAILLVGSIYMLNMLYTRSEPTWLTPMFDKLALFFPTQEKKRNEYPANP